MKESIFYLEDRAGAYLYHFFIYNLGGLYYILNEKYNVRGQSDSCLLLEDTSKIVNFHSNQLTFPIKIHMKDILPFQQETFEIIKDKFELIEDLSKVEDYEIVSIYGEPSIHKICENENIIYPFIRKLFLDEMKIEIIQKKNIYYKKNSEGQHNGILRRYILNEAEIIKKLEKYNFEYIQLEDYNMHDKIKLFMESEIIMSSHSSALTLTLFCNKNTKIIEILKNGTIGFYNTHYINIANEIGLNYNRFNDINEDDNGNFTLDFSIFEDFLQKLL